METDLDDRAQVERAPQELAGLGVPHGGVQPQDRAFAAPASIVRGVGAEVYVAEFVTAQQAARQECERGLFRPLAGY